MKFGAHTHTSIAFVIFICIHFLSAFFLHMKVCWFWKQRECNVMVRERKKGGLHLCNTHNWINNGFDEKKANINHICFTHSFVRDATKCCCFPMGDLTFVLKTRCIWVCACVCVSAESKCRKKTFLLVVPYVHRNLQAIIISPSLKSRARAEFNIIQRKKKQQSNARNA